MANDQGATKVAVTAIPDIPEGVDLNALGEGADQEVRAQSGVYVGAEMTLEQFRAWFAKQPLGAMPYNAVGFHHTYKPNEQEWRGLTTLAGVFRYYNQTLGWTYGYGPHIFLYAGDGPYKSGQKLVYVATHPEHDGVAIACRNQRFLHIECVGYYDARPMPKAMQELAGDVLGIVCGRRGIPIKDIGAGWDAPANPAGVVLHRNAPNAGKSCPGWEVKTLPKPSARPEPTKPHVPPKPGEKRRIGEIRGAAIHPLDKVLAWAKSRKAAKPALEMIPTIYKYAPQRNIGADVLSAQMCHETAFGKYGGASKKYNGAGIKKANATGDEPSDFEVPKTADEGARQLVNHWCAVLGLDPIGKPHGRYAVAKAVYAKRPPITRIDQLGNGNWATDPQYADKLVAYLTEIGKGSTPATPAPKPAPKPPADDLERDVEEAIGFALQLVGTSYGTGWEEGTWPDLHPLYARITRSDPASYYRKYPMVCSGLGNVLRYEIAGLPAFGRKQGDAYPGGTAAIGRHYAYAPGTKPYPIVENTPRGWAIWSPYLGSALPLQGHISFALGDGKVVEARVPAASANRTEDQVHRALINGGGRGNERIIPPEIWLRQ